MLKNILIVFIVCFTVVLLPAQDNFRLSHNYATKQGGIDEEIVPSVSIRNLTNQVLHLKWEVKKANLSQGWQVAVCDRQCYTPLVSSNTFTLQPYEVLHDFRINFRPNGKEGIGTVEVALYEEGASTVAEQLITFSGAAQMNYTSTSRLVKGSGVPKVYPNPAIEYIYLEDDYSAVKLVEIYNVVGRKMQTFSVDHAGEKYDVSRLPRGIYMVRMLDANGNIVRTQRVNKYNP